MSKKEQNLDNPIPELQVTTDDNQSSSKEDTPDRETCQQTVCASSPFVGRNPGTFSVHDISSINLSTNPGSSNLNRAASMPSLYASSVQGGCKPKLAAPTASRKKKQKSNIDPQRRLEDLKTKYVQLYALCKLKENRDKKEKSQLEEILAQLQNRIAEDRCVLEKTKQQIQQIKINHEIESIHQLHGTVYKQVLDKLDSNCDVTLKETCDLLEHYKDKVPIKDIELPENGLEQLEKNMKNVVETVTSLSSKQNLEVYNQIGKLNATLKKCEALAKGCKDKLEEMEYLKLQETSLKISYGDDV